MTEQIAEASPRFKARIAGVFYLLVFLTGGFALFANGRLVVSGNAAATATNILAHEQLFRWGWASNVIAAACYLAVTALLYELFKPVNRSLSLVAAFCSLAGCATGGVAAIFDLAPVVVLKGAMHSSVFRPEQLQAMAYLFLRLSTLGGNVALIFFGFYCVLIGTLAFKSTFLPRTVGVLMVFAGLGWLTNSFASFLLPPLAGHLLPYILLPGFIGEASLTLWLLVIGVNVQRWTEQAGAANWRSRSSFA